MRLRLPFLACALVLSLSALSALSARAARAEGEPDAVRPADEQPRRAERPWLYADDATTPGQWQAQVGTRLTYSGGDRSVTRPFASNLSAPGGLAEVNGEVGLLPMLSVSATGVMGLGDTLSGGMTAGLRFAPLANAKIPFRLVLGGGYLLERSAGNGMFFRVAATYDAGAFRFGGTFHGEHVFLPGRDSVDAMMILAANVKLGRIVRLGIEYVAQDLEGYVDNEEAEGGVRHFLGPTSSFELLQKRLFIAFGPAVGLSYGSPKLVGRVSVAYAF